MDKSPSRGASPSGRLTLVVDRYAVYDEFAAGGMATVHFARFLGPQGFRRVVAVKRLLPHLTRDQDLSVMLMDEARLAARVRHPNVVSTLDVVQTDSELLLVMDYVHGESLFKLARAAHALGERVPLAIATAIVSDALHGLHAAHEAKDERGAPLGLVHRDVSPQNVLVGADGITRIADFGVAKASGRAQTTRDGALKGKLAYMAPEQISGGHVTRASDVFSASVVLWELFTGTRLFTGNNHAEVVFKVMSQPIPAPSEVSLPPALVEIVMRGLSRDPALRFESAREMALALEANAPSVRASEIAAWVERIAGDKLAARAEVLSIIEHQDEHQGEIDEQASTLPNYRSSHPPAEATSRDALEDSTQRRPSVPTEPGDSSVPSELQPSNFGKQGSAEPSDATLRRRLILMAAFALTALAGAGTTAYLLSTRTRYAAAPSAAETTAPSVGASVDTPSAAPAAPPAAPAPIARVVVDASSSEPVDAAVDGDAGVSDSPLKKRARPQKRSCTPPYTTDAEGRVIFKLECL